MNKKWNKMNLSTVCIKTRLNITLPITNYIPPCLGNAFLKGAAVAVNAARLRLYAWR